MSSIRFLIVVLFFITSSLNAKADVSTSGLLVEEVLAQREDPREFDWKKIPLQVELGASFVYEANVFKSRSYNLGVAHSLSRALLFRGAVRRVETVATSSSEQVALTIFSQAGQPSRFEFLAGLGYVLLDGRSTTALSPRITDIGHALIAIGGLHYNLFDSKDAAPVAGMRAIYSPLVAEAGVRFQVYLPQSLGVGLEWTYSRAIIDADPDLPDWMRFGGSLSWSFGQ
jgi:hypothetical protein